VLNHVYCVVDDRERVGVSKNDNNEQHTEDKDHRFCRLHYCEPSKVTRWRSQWREIHKIEFAELPEECKHASISASKCVVVDGNKHLDVLMLNFPNSSDYN
jgi:hypothetical protein